MGRIIVVLLPLAIVVVVPPAALGVFANSVVANAMVFVATATTTVTTTVTLRGGLPSVFLRY